MRIAPLLITVFFLTLAQHGKATESVIAMRKQGMQFAEEAMKIIKKSITYTDLNQIRLSSKSMLEWASIMREYFPPNSGASVDNLSAASDEIWQNPRLFESLIDEKQNGVKKMLAAANDGDIQTLTEAFIEIHNTCNSCHERFRN